MKTYTFETRMTALSSISHNGGQSFGINSKLRREKFVQPDGSVEEVPVLSGNGLRGMLRDRGMLHMCHALGYGVDGESNEVRGLTLSAFYFLFSGGALTGDGGKVVNLERAREIQRLIPLSSVFGGAIGNMILPGKLKMGKAIPICAETSHLLPADFQSTVSIWEYLQEEMYTRKDDEKNEHLRSVIEPGTRKLLDAAKAERAARITVVEETGQSQQMRYYAEVFAAGTVFYWKIVLDDVTDIEFGAFLSALVEFSRRPYVGGKSNVGLGEVALKCGSWFEIDSRLESSSREISVPAGNSYAKHLTDNSAAIRDMLSAL